MIENYNIDQVLDYGVEQVDQHKIIVNPDYRKLTNQLKKVREKKYRLQAKFYDFINQVVDNDVDQIPALTKKQIDFKERIDHLLTQEHEIAAQRKNTPARIPLKQMKQDKQYNKLSTESKLFLNIIKMICYRAESIMAEFLPNTLKGEKRMCIKQLIDTDADLIPDYENNTLTVVLHSLSAQRFTQAIKEICDFLNFSQTIFPGTNLKMIFKTNALSFY